jgi:hypothetical protein
MSNSTNKLFAKLAHGFANDPKIVGLSHEAFRAYIELLLYSCQNMTDGFLDDRIVQRMGWRDEAEELTQNDAQPSFMRVEGGYQIHAFCDWQMTTEAHQRKVEAGRAGGLAKAEARRQASQRLAGANDVPEQTASKPLLDKEEDKDKDKDLKPLSANSRKTQMRADWEPSDTLLATVPDKYPLVDIAYESERFVNYWLSTGTPMMDWGRTWQNWMLRKQKELSDRVTKTPDWDPDAWMNQVVKWGPERYE